MLISACSLAASLGTIAFGEALDRLAALLEQGAEYLNLLGIREGLALVDLSGAQGRFDHAQGEQAMLVVGLHRDDDVGIDSFADAHSYSFRG